MGKRDVGSDAPTKDFLSIKAIVSELRETIAFLCFLCKTMLYYDKPHTQKEDDKMTREQIKSLIIGHAIGDALGVPVEFNSRDKLEKNPVTDMIGYGTYDMPEGTWSDDTSMTLCLLESLARLGAVDYDDIMKNFLRWMNNSEFTPTNKVFDIGITTREALMDYELKKPPLLCGGAREDNNGNGSLMRISPIAPYLYLKSGNNLTDADLRIVHNISRLTHGHIRSQMGCGIFVFIAVQLISGENLAAAIISGVEKAYDYYTSSSEFASEIETYNNVWNIEKFAKSANYNVKSTGYVVYSLEAALWCLLNTDNYDECVLKAVNLGGDTDTIAAIAGGLAGLSYGLQNIPQTWKNTLIRYDYIEEICEKFAGEFNVA